MNKIIAVSALSLLLLGAGSAVALADDSDSDVVCKADDAGDIDELGTRIKLATGLLELSDDDDDEALLDLGAVLRLVSDDDDCD